MNEPAGAAGPPEVDIDAGVLRAAVYRLLAKLLVAPPDTELLETLAALEPREPDDAPLAPAWRRLASASAAASPGALDDEYHTLFVGLGRGELLPYGSWYRTGSLLDRPLAVLRRDLRELGLERRGDCGEAEDHAGAVCEAMSVLAAAGQRPLHEQRDFFGSHAGSWLPDFFHDLRTASGASFYAAVGELGERFMAFEADYLNMSN